jgi:uncharacterized RDD family membrane protein YckC
MSADGAQNGGAPETEAVLESRGFADAESRAQAAAARRARGPAAITPTATRYVGMATRAIAFVIDLALINLVAVLVGVAVGLTMSTLKFSSNLETVVAGILGVVYIGWTLAYFVVFWSSTGQTPGNRLLQIRVVDAAHEGPLPARRAAVRLVALVGGVMALGMGEWIALLDDKSRTFQDRVAGTVVVDAPVSTFADQQRMARKEALVDAVQEEQTAPS